MPTFQWTEALEAKALQLKQVEGKTYIQIANELNTTISSVKHKIRRLQQKMNLDKYKHTDEKTEQILPALKQLTKPLILETHAGFGGMTQLYSLHGDVTSIELVEERIEALKQLGLKHHRIIKGDCEKTVFQLIADKQKFQLIDIDPYGYPSRLFPHVFNLIDNGFIVITLPMIGVAQMNKVTIEHLRVFWDVDYRDRETYLKKVTSKLRDYAFMHKLALEIIDVSKFDRIFRILVRVDKTSLNKMVGLKINRPKKTQN